MEGKSHVLIIDGDRINRAATSLMIEKAGYKIFEAFNGIHALDMLKENYRVDAIVLNRTLSGMMSSVDFMQRIQAQSAVIRNIPVLMLTDRVEKNRLKSSMIFGITEVIYKPVDETFLHKTLEKILYKKC